MNSFTITAASKEARLNTEGAASVTFTVTNTTKKPLRCTPKLKPLGSTGEKWLRLQGDGTRNFSPEQSQQFVVEINMPAGTPGGAYSFGLNVSNEALPDEDFTEGPAVSFQSEARAAAPSRPSSSWWIWLVLGLIVVGGGVAVWLLLPGKARAPLLETRSLAAGQVMDLKTLNVAPDSVVTDFGFRLAGTSGGKATLVFVSGTKVALIRRSKTDSGGCVTPLFGGRIESADFAGIQPDGRIVVMGSSQNNLSASPDKRILFKRFTTNGELDPWFPRDGGFAGLLGQASRHRLTGLHIQPDGKVLVAWREGTNLWKLVRCDGDGRLDPSFGQSGVATMRFRSPPQRMALTTLDAGGRVILAGDFLSEGESRIAFARFLPTGAIDESFGNRGQAILPAPRADLYWDLEALSTQPDGKLLVAGRRVLVAGVQSNDFVLMRLTEAGALDTTFAEAGSVLTSTGHKVESVRALLRQADGKIVVTGEVGDFANPADGAQTFVARFEPEGLVDRAFGQNGVVVLKYSTVADDSRITSLVQLGDDKLLVGGMAGYRVDLSAIDPTTADFLDALRMDLALTRLNSDGRRDQGFGNDGTVIAKWLGERLNGMTRLIRKPDGKLLAIGFTNVAGYSAISIGRLHSDGRWDTAFGKPYETDDVVAGKADANLSALNQLEVRPGMAFYCRSNRDAALVWVDEVPTGADGQVTLSSHRWTRD